MKKIIIIYSFLLFQIINAQNDITSIIFSWTTYPTLGKTEIQVSENFQSDFLVRWNDDKIVNNDPIYLYTFFTDEIPSNLVGKEDDINSLLSNAASSWNNCYPIQIEIDDYAEEAVAAYFYDNPDFFITSSGEYAQAVTRFPVLWNSSNEQFEIYEELESSINLTIDNGLDMIFFYNHDNAPTWTTSTNPENGYALLGTVMLHEIGHVLCMGHNVGDYPTRIMNSPYNSATALPVLTTGDITNASYHYTQLYENTGEDYLYNEGLVEFIPRPNAYSEGTEINMVLKSDHITRNNIYYNLRRVTDPSDEYFNTPDVTTDYCQYKAWADWDPNKRSLGWPGYWYYFKAAVWNESGKIFEGQTEGIYYCSETVGVEDGVYFAPLLSSYQTNTIYSPGSAYYRNFIDYAPLGDYIVSWDNWKCYANNGCGDILIMDSQSFSIPTLTEGFNWERDANGNVIATMTTGGTDNDGYHHTASSEIKISGVPNNFITSGTIPVNTTWCGDLTISGDIIVPVGKQLTVLLNSHITFINGSSLIVEGNLIFETHDFRMSVIDFQSQNSTLKNGIKVNAGGVANISNAEIRNAYTGIYVNGGSANIDNCLIRNGYSGIHLYGSNSVANITNTRIYEQTVGINLYYSNNVHLSHNQIDHNYIAISAYASSPYLAPDDYNSESVGYNNIHTNSFGIMASYNSNPFLGRVSCLSLGGNNIIDLNTTKDINLNSYCTVYAENNWWGGGSGLYYKGTGCYIYDIPLLTSPPQMSQNKIKITPEEEVFNKKFVPQVTSSANATEPLSLVTSTNEKSNYNDKWSIEWKLLYARNLIRLKKYNAAADICESVITEFPDSARSYLALDLLWQARKNDNKTLFNQFVDYKAKSKVKKQLFGAAEIMLALDQKESRISTLEKIEAKYKDTPLIEHVLFSKFMYYLYEENNIELAKTTADELGKLYPESESYYASQRHLGNDVVKPTEQLLAKEAVNEATTEIPQTYELLGNYPNPFNPSTTIKYALPYSSDVELTIYDITGKVITTLNRNGQSAGYQNIVWNGNSQQGSRVSSGVYFYRFKASSIDGSNKVFEKTAKMLMLK